MKELKKPKVLILVMLVLIYVLSKSETREGFSRREAKGGFRCMIGGKNNELQCNTFEEGGKNRKKFTCTRDGACKVKGGGKFDLPRVKTATMDSVFDRVMTGLGYKYK